METALYYVFSTIAQTLAGVLAILGAFLLFHLGRIGDQLSERLKELKERYNKKGGHAELQALSPQDDAEALIAYFAKDHHRVLDNKFDRVRLKQAQKLFAEKARLLSAVVRVTRATIATMIASFVVLAMTPPFASLPGWPRVAVFVVVCAGGISSAGFCLVRYGQLARLIVGVGRKE